MGVYPGLGLPLRYWPEGFLGDESLPTYPIGAHTNSPGSNSEMLPVRELAMMMVMDRLTDKPDWHKKVFDDTIVAKWRDEALAIPDSELCSLATRGKSRNAEDELAVLKNILTEGAFSLCVEELRTKARYYEETGLIPTFDATATVVKSDVLVKDELREALKTAFQKLQASQAESPDWHPGSGDKVQDLVHPSMYPLVYGQTRVLEDEVVGVTDAIRKWAGKGEIVEKLEVVESTPSHPRHYIDYGIGGSNIPPSYWSDTYQWLPANVAFQDDGGVKFTSYINNLHPNKHPEIYQTVEKLVETVLPAWDQCLVEYINYSTRLGPGRTTPRLKRPDNPDDENPENWTPDREEMENIEVDLKKDDRYQDYEDSLEELKWLIVREPAMTSFDETEHEDIDYKVVDGLRKKFEKSGLQVIVKLASIELTPENPDFPVGGWHIEGQMNERICATALYYLDSENITDSSLSFRMQTSTEQDDDYQVGQDGFHWMESVYGTGLGSGSGWSCLQNYGTVETPQGRVLAFPNVFQHRVSPFKLVDPTKPGHRRFIALWLVDPHIRIISTANVPPQQQDWWMESVFGSSSESQESAASKIPSEMLQLLHEKGVSIKGTETSGEKTKLPIELVDMVRKQFDGATPMSIDEAKEHRAKLMQARTAFQGEAEHNWDDVSYSFCEH